MPISNRPISPLPFPGSPAAMMTPSWPAYSPPRSAAACPHVCFRRRAKARGRVVLIYAFSASYLDTRRTLGVRPGLAAAGKAGEIAPIVAGEMAALAADATEEETARARAQLKATLLMALESPSSRVERIASQLPVHGRVLSVPELLKRLEAVDAAAVRRFAAKVCERGEPAVAAVGPVKEFPDRAICLQGAASAGRCLFSVGCQFSRRHVFMRA